jgi:hypothetical protein
VQLAAAVKRFALSLALVCRENLLVTNVARLKVFT